jgi:beta-barrel assembly-enhancing protease
MKREHRGLNSRLSTIRCNSQSLIPSHFKKEEVSIMRQALKQVGVRLTLTAISLSFLWIPHLWAQTEVEPGFNLFSTEQDVEVGRQSAAEVERQLPLLTSEFAESYINKIGTRLAEAAPGAKYPYQFKVTNVSDINAFALPGGFMYVNRGLIEAAGDEGELTGVLAHEMAHVALRHGTNQASKAYLGQAGLGLLGGLLGQGKSSDIIGAVGGFGLNTLFLKFGRTAERQADIVGAQMMARAGYDPMAMARFFEKLRQQAGDDPGKLEQFFSSHPAPVDRMERVREEARLLGSFRRTSPVGSFDEIKSKLKELSPASSMQEIADNQGSQEAGGEIEPASTDLKMFDRRGGPFRIRYPANWDVREHPDGYGVTMFPKGGIIDSGRGQQEIIYGMIIDRYNLSEGDVTDDFRRRGRSQGSRSPLEQATESVVHRVIKSNPYLDVVKNSKQREIIDGAQGFSIILSGRSPVTGEDEQVTIFTRSLVDEHIIYALFIAPASEYGKIGNTFERMISSLRINEGAMNQ